MPTLTKGLRSHVIFNSLYLTIDAHLRKGGVRL
jgi:hypothetical protein